MILLTFPIYAALISGLLIAGIWNRTHLFVGLGVLVFYSAAVYVSGETLESILLFWQNVLQA